MVLCRFESHLGLESSGFNMWHFWKLVTRGFLRVLQFPPLLHPLMVQPIKYSSNKCNFNSVELNSWAVPLWHVTRHVACDKRWMCCTWFAHGCARATCAYVLETVCGAVTRLCEKSWIAPLNAVITIVIIILGADVLRQLCMLPYWDRSHRSSLIFRVVTIYWHCAN